MRLILVRHGESEGNAARIYQGWLDRPLSTVGEQQASITARWLAARRDLRPVALYASPLLRAWRTGEIIGAALGLNPIAVPELREINVGAATGLTHAEVTQRWPDRAEERVRLGLDHGWPEGDSGHTFRKRVAAGLESIVRRHQNASATDTIIVATHGETIHFLTMHLQGTLDGAWPDGWVANCAVTEAIRRSQGWQVVCAYDAAHLEERESTREQPPAR